MEIKQPRTGSKAQNYWNKDVRRTTMSAEMGVVAKLASEIWQATHSCHEQERDTTHNEKGTHENKELTMHVERDNTTHVKEKLEQWKQMQRKVWQRQHKRSRKKWKRKRKPKSTEWRIFPAASCCDDLFFMSCVLKSVSIQKHSDKSKKAPVVFLGSYLSSPRQIWSWKNPMVSKRERCQAGGKPSTWFPPGTRRAGHQRVVCCSISSFLFNSLIPRILEISWICREYYLFLQFFMNALRLPQETDP